MASSGSCVYRASDAGVYFFLAHLYANVNALLLVWFFLAHLYSYVHPLLLGKDLLAHLYAHILPLLLVRALISSSLRKDGGMSSLPGAPFLLIFRMEAFSSWNVKGLYAISGPSAAGLGFTCAVFTDG